MAYPVADDPTAVFGRRVIAALIDALIVLVPTFLLASAEFEYLSVADLPVSAEQFCEDRMDDGQVCADFSDVDDRVYFADSSFPAATGWYWAANAILLVVVQAFTGWTIGKLLLGIRAVDEMGRPPGLLKALVRWLLWIVDGFPYVLPLVGFIVGLTTVGHRRVGDMAAKTFVVGRAAAGSPVVVPGVTAPPAPTGWGAAPAPAPPSAEGPQWDEARGTYIQWDADQQRWMQWSESTRTWSPI